MRFFDLWRRGAPSRARRSLRRQAGIRCQFRRPIGSDGLSGRAVAFVEQIEDDLRRAEPRISAELGR